MPAFTVEIIDPDNHRYVIKTSHEDPSGAAYSAAREVAEDVADMRLGPLEPDETVEPDEVQISTALDDLKSIRVFEGQHDEIPAGLVPVHVESDLDGANDAGPLRAG